MIELSIVGEQEQPFGILVQSSDGKHFEMFPFFGDQVNDHGIMFIFGGAQISRGFVEHEINEFPIWDEFAVEFDFIGFADLKIGRRRYGAVHRDRAVTDQFPDFAAAEGRGIRNEFVQSHIAS